MNNKNKSIALAMGIGAAIVAAAAAIWSVKVRKDALDFEDCNDDNSFEQLNLAEFNNDVPREYVSINLNERKDS